MFKNNSKSIYTIVIVSLLAISSLSFAKPTIKALTSKKSSQKANVVNLGRDSSSINEHMIGLGVGQTILLGDFRNKADDQITGELFYSYSASHSFDMIINAHYSKHTFDGNKVEIPGLSIGIKGKAFQFDKFSPFVIAGLGFYRPTINSSRKKITFGYHLGAGADLKLNNHLVLGVLGHLHNPFDVKIADADDIEGAYFKMLLTIGYIF